MAERTCSVEGCELPGRARSGLCAKHYVARYRRNSMNPCAIGGCTGVRVGRGYCQRHYDLFRHHGHPLYEPPPAPTKPTACSIDGCDRQPLARGWCKSHYRRWLEHGDPEFVRPRGPVICTIDGCDKPAHSRGMCDMHYWRNRVHGSPHALAEPKARVPDPCSVEGCAKTAVVRGMCSQHYAYNDRRIRAEHHKVAAAARRADPAYRERDRQSTAAWKAANPGAYQRWAAANPELVCAASKRRRARKKGAAINDFTAAQWRDMKAAHGHRCVYCGEKKLLTQDHVIPLSKRGNHTASNVVPACQSCNSRKGAGPPPPTFKPALM